MHTCRLLLIDLHFCLCRSILCHVTWEYSKLLSCIWSNLKRELYTMMQLFLVFSWAKLIKSKIGIICQWHVPQTGSSFTGSRWNRNLEVLGFVNGGYAENPEKNLRARQEPTTTQPAYIRCKVWDSNSCRQHWDWWKRNCSHHSPILAPQ